jgi:F-type H+-transporting ATPase subunit alpha
VSQSQLDRGYRLTEILKQPQNAPMPVEEQVLVIYAGTKGHVDDVAVADVTRFETELVAYVKANHSDVLETIRSTKALPDGDQLDDAINAFKKTFAASEQSG